MRCPLCNGINIGKVGTAQYYCSNCLMEFAVHDSKGVTVYYVDEEGSLIALSEMAQDGQALEQNLLG